MRIPFLPTSRKRAVPDPLVPAMATSGSVIAGTKTANAPHASLADIVGRRTPILWFEAVAIVQALCVVLIDADGTEARVPDLTDTFIKAEGRVETTARYDGHAGVQPLARTLHVLVTGEQVPPPLRLFISKWISADEHPLRDFVEGLAYFARPDGAALIRAVYERYLAMPELPAGAIIPKPELEAPKPTPQPQRRRIPRWVAAAAAVAIIGGALIVWSLGGASGEASGSTFSRVVADGRRALDTAREELAQRLGIGTSSTLEARKEVPTTTPAAPPRPRLRSVQPAVIVQLPTLAIPLVRQSFDPDHGPWLITPPETLTALPQEANDDLLAAGPVDDPFTEPDVVYTNADVNVEPPQMVYPHLPRVPLPGPEVNSMEVIVGEDGSVERVRLVSAARRMTDMMLLSGAKSWRFAPALRDGQPVRYRITINWSASQ